MDEPRDFGCSTEATLSRVVGGHPAPGFARFWRGWWDGVATRGSRFLEADESPRLREPSVCGAVGVTHVVESVDGVRIGARLVYPFAADGGGDESARMSATPELVCVVLHGYGMAPGEALTDESPRPLGAGPRVGESPARLALLKLRVRGYPGSQADTGDLTTEPPGYAGHAVHDERHWPVALAVRDVVSAVLAVRRCWPSARVAVWGESFGGGLAVIAAGVLAFDPAASAPIDRMVVGLPTLGDWAWRLRHPAPSGLGAHVASFLEHHPAARADAVRNLLDHDAAHHARRVTCPVLAKLARRDEVVPAPSAAAVFNALATGPGEKWRVTTRYGHYAPTVGDGEAVADARRHALFDRAALTFLDPHGAIGEGMDELVRRLSAVRDEQA